METKKISFGFNKLKKLNLIPTSKPEEKSSVHLIDYLEDSSIKVIGGENDEIKTPLVIPMKPNKKLLNLEELIKNDFVVTENDVKIENEIKIEDTLNSKPEESLTLDELATRELLNDVKNEDKKEETKVIEVPNSDKVTLEGEKESTIEDYENVPVTKFGFAMLRGMGWQEGLGIGKNQKVVTTAQPVLRPKGMGLGADKLTKMGADVKPAVDKDGKKLTCCKKAFVKVIAGYHKGSYGQIMGLDDESGRFIIKTALNNINISLNEFLVTPVTKEEFVKNSKVLNYTKYEEYLKKKEQIKTENNSSEEDEKRKAKPKNLVKKEPRSTSEEDEQERRRKIASKDAKKNQESDGEKSETDRKRKPKKDKKQETDDTDEEEERQRKKNKKNKKTRRRTSSEEETDKQRHRRRDNSDEDNERYRRKTHKRDRSRERKHKSGHKSKEKDRNKHDKDRKR